MELNYDKLFGWFKKKVNGLQVALIERGNERKELSQRQKELWESLGMKCDWYYYPNEVDRFELAKECRDLKPHYDALYIQNDVNHYRHACNFANTVDLKDKKVLIIGQGAAANELALNLVGRCRVSVMTNGDAWQYVPLSDVIFTAKELNCYAIKIPIIEIGDAVCVNCEDREVYSRLGDKPLWNLPFWIL